MPPRIDEPASALTMLVCWRSFFDGSSSQRMFINRVAIVDVDDELHRATSAVASGMDELHFGKIIGQVELRLADRHLRVSYAAIGHLE